MRPNKARPFYGAHKPAVQRIPTARAARAVCRRRRSLSSTRRRLPGRGRQWRVSWARRRDRRVGAPPTEPGQQVTAADRPWPAAWAAARPLFSRLGSRKIPGSSLQVAATALAAAAGTRPGCPGEKGSSGWRSRSNEPATALLPHQDQPPGTTSNSAHSESSSVGGVGCSWVLSVGVCREFVISRSPVRFR